MNLSEVLSGYENRQNIEGGDDGKDGKMDESSLGTKPIHERDRRHLLFDP
jgi:hypothetical protein